MLACMKKGFAKNACYEILDFQIIQEDIVKP